MIEMRAANGQVYRLSPNTLMTDFVLWAAVEGYRVKWVRNHHG